MTIKRAIEVLRNETECVIRAEYCNRDCGSCPLVLPDEEILAAYALAVVALQEFQCQD